MQVVAPGRGVEYALVFGCVATLAQLVEQRFCKAQVVGSNPTGGSWMVGSQFKPWELSNPLCVLLRWRRGGRMFRTPVPSPGVPGS